MKTIATVWCLILAGAASGGEPKLTKERVTTIGMAVLGLSQFHQYEGGFETSRPTYSAKEGRWSFQATGKFPAAVHQTGGLLYFFEIRDADGFFRIGFISPKTSPRNGMTFRKPPHVQEKSENRSLESPAIDTTKGEQDGGGQPATQSRQAKE